MVRIRFARLWRISDLCGIAELIICFDQLKVQSKAIAKLRWLLFLQIYKFRLESDKINFT